MKVGVLVNTCDRFSDCWELFFHQWKKHRNGIDWPLYLNTERATYTYPEGITGHALTVCTPSPETGLERWERPGFPTWSWCVEHALRSMPEEIVLYMQEDYFLTRDLDTQKITQVLQLMEKHPDIECVHLNIAGNHKNKECPYPGLRRASRRDCYFVSCQAALWRKATLLELLREHENAWQFERWGTNRARALRCHFYTAAIGSSPVDYFCTGIVQGKWLHPVEEIFNEAGIKMDFTKRGWWRPRKGIMENLRWIIQKVVMRTWPPRSLISVIASRFSEKRRTPYPSTTPSPVA